MVITHTHTLAQRPRPRPHQSRRQAIEALSTARPVIASVRRAALDAPRPLEHGQLTVLLSPPTTPPPSLLMYERTPCMAATVAPPLLRFHPNLVPANHASLRSPAATNPGHPSPPPRCGAGTPPTTAAARAYTRTVLLDSRTLKALSLLHCALSTRLAVHSFLRRRVWLRPSRAAAVVAFAHFNICKPS